MAPQIFLILRATQVRQFFSSAISYDYTSIWQSHIEAMER